MKIMSIISCLTNTGKSNRFKKRVLRSPFSKTSLKPYKSIFPLLFSLFPLLFSLSACDNLNSGKTDILQKIQDEVSYANASYADVSIGIISGSLSAAPTEAPREKVGYAFTVQAAANAGYGFVGWRVLSKDAWDALDQASASFETDFIEACAAEEYKLAEISDVLELNGRPSGRADIIALTKDPIVIVPYATMQPALSGSSYPAMNAYNIYYLSQIEIRFSAAVAEDSFIWQENKTTEDETSEEEAEEPEAPAFKGDIKNISISALTSTNIQLSPEELEPLFIVDHDDTEDGKLLKLRLGSVGSIPLYYFDDLKITIALGEDIERRGAPGIKIMPRQELVYTVTTNTVVVNTRLNSLEVTIDGNTHYLSDKAASEFEFTIPAVYSAQNVTVEAEAMQPTEVRVSPSGAISAFSTVTALAGGKNLITIVVAQNSGGGQSIYRIIINNYPSSTATTVTLTPATGQLNAAWTPVIGASGYWVYSNTSNDLVSAQRLPNVVNGTSAAINGPPGSTHFVWVQAVSGADENHLDSPVFSAENNSARILGSNNTLQTLGISSYTITPSFYYNTGSYEMLEDLPNDKSSVTVMFDRWECGQTVIWKMNGGADSENITGDTFDAIGISRIGPNTLTITVGAADGSEPKTYTILIYKRPAAPSWAATPLNNFSEGHVQVNWTLAGVSGHSGIEVYRSAISNAGAGGTAIDEQSNTATQTIVGDLLVNSVYYFWLRSYWSEGGRKVYSNWSSVQTLSTTITMSAFTIKDMSSGIEYPTGGNTDFLLELGYSAQRTLEVTANPTSAAAAAVITAGDSTISFDDNIGTINWADKYSTSFKVTVTAQHPYFKQEYNVSILRTNLVPLGGIVSISKPTDREINLITVTARTDNHLGTNIGTASATVSTGSLGTGSTAAECLWYINALSANVVGQTILYWTVSIVDTDGNTYTTQSTSPHTGGISTDGESDINHAIAIYSVNIPAATGGTISTIRPAYLAGEIVTLTAMPNPNYVFSGKPLVSGVAAGSVLASGSSFTFSMPAANVNVTTNTANRFLSTDATLSALSITDNATGTIYSTGSTSYMLELDYAATHTLTVNATKANADASVVITADDGTISFDNTTATIDWGTVYSTGFNVTVTAQNGSSTQEYKVTITRPIMVMLSGTVEVSKPSDHVINVVTVTARKDNHSGTVLGTASAAASLGSLDSGSDEAECTWTINALSANIADVTTLYWTVSMVDIDGYMYTSQTTSSHPAITTTGVSGIARSITIYSVRVTQQTGSVGTISALRPAYQAGETVTLTAMPSQNYIFNGTPVVTGGSVGSVSNPSGNNFTFSMPTANVTVSTDTSNRFYCTDATLNTLPLSGISYTFSPYTTSYTISSSVANTSVTPTKLNPSNLIAISINSVSTPSGTSRAINTGRNIIEVEVRPEAYSLNAVTYPAVTYTITVNKSPAAPTDTITLTPGYDRVTASWNAVIDADRYEVEYSTTSGFSSVTSQVVSGTSVPLMGTGISQGTRYFVRVRASKDSVTSGYTSNTTGSVPGLAANYGELQSMLTQVPASGTIYLLNTGTFNVDSALNIPIGKTITLVPHNGTAGDNGTVTLKRQSGYNGELINVNAGGTLNLRAANSGSGIINIDGGAVWTDTALNPGYMNETEITGIKTATSAAIVVYGTMTMYNNVNIQNNYNSAAWVSATGAGGGGGVSIFGGGIFTMAGGAIRQNYAANGGGVCINANNGVSAFFSMTGGQINTNLAGTTGGGVCSRLCTATLSGGLISHNSINYNNSTYGSGWHAMVIADSTLTGVNTSLITNSLNQGNATTNEYNGPW